MLCVFCASDRCFPVSHSLIPSRVTKAHGKLCNLTSIPDEHVKSEEQNKGDRVRQGPGNLELMVLWYYLPDGASKGRRVACECVCACIVLG